MAQRIRLPRPRIRLVDDDANELVGTIRRAVNYANEFKQRRKQTTLDLARLNIDVRFTFTITSAGIEVQARYLCFRATALASFDQLAATRCQVLQSTVQTAYRSLIYHVQRLRMTPDVP